MLTRRKPFIVMYADGTYAVCRDKALKDAYKTKLVHPIGGYSYLDGVITGFLLWNANWWSISTGRISGFHNRSSSFKRVRPTQLYLILEVLLQQPY